MFNTSSDPYEKAVEDLCRMPDEQRNAYVIAVLDSLTESARVVAETQGLIAQLQTGKALLNSIKEQKAEILPVILYIIQPEFREKFVEMLEKFAVMFDKPQQPE